MFSSTIDHDVYKFISCQSNDKKIIAEIKTYGSVSHDRSEYLLKGQGYNIQLYMYEHLRFLKTLNSFKNIHICGVKLYNDLFFEHNDIINVIDIVNSNVVNSNIKCFYCYKLAKNTELRDTMYFYYNNEEIDYIIPKQNLRVNCHNARLRIQKYKNIHIYAGVYYLCDWDLEKIVCLQNTFSQDLEYLLRNEHLEIFYIFDALNYCFENTEKFEDCLEIYNFIHKLYDIVIQTSSIYQIFINIHLYQELFCHVLLSDYEHLDILKTLLNFPDFIIETNNNL